MGFGSHHVPGGDRHTSSEEHYEIKPGDSVPSNTRELKECGCCRTVHYQDSERSFVMDSHTTTNYYYCTQHWCQKKEKEAEWEEWEWEEWEAERPEREARWAEERRQQRIKEAEREAKRKAEWMPKYEAAEVEMALKKTKVLDCVEKLKLSALKDIKEVCKNNKWNCEVFTRSPGHIVVNFYCGPGKDVGSNCLRKLLFDYEKKAGKYEFQARPTIATIRCQDEKYHGYKGIMRDNGQPPHSSIKKKLCLGVFDPNFDPKGKKYKSNHEKLLDTLHRWKERDEVRQLKGWSTAYHSSCEGSCHERYENSDTESDSDSEPKTKKEKRLKLLKEVRNKRKNHSASKGCSSSEEDNEDISRVPGCSKKNLKKRKKPKRIRIMDSESDNDDGVDLVDFDEEIPII